MSNEIPEPIFLSAPKAATLCGVSRNTICCWIRESKLASYRTAGGKNLIRPSDLVAFMRTNAMFVPQSLAEMAEADERVMGSASTSNTTDAEPSILVVDDDAGARTLAVRCLEDIGLPVHEAETGFEALHDRCPSESTLGVSAGPRHAQAKQATLLQQRDSIAANYAPSQTCKRLGLRPPPAGQVTVQTYLCIMVPTAV